MNVKENLTSSVKWLGTRPSEINVYFPVVIRGYDCSESHRSWTSLIDSRKKVLNHLISSWEEVIKEESEQNAYHTLISQCHSPGDASVLACKNVDNKSKTQNLVAQSTRATGMRRTIGLEMICCLCSSCRDTVSVEMEGHCRSDWYQ